MLKHVVTLAVASASLMILGSGCATLLDVDFGSAHTDADAGSGGDGSTGPCVPKDCKAQTLECGTANDTCGNAIECGTCATGICKAGKCACVPKTCPQLGASCGKVDDGCGGSLDCGVCTNPTDACNGTNNKCECKPKDCKAQNAVCGTVPDGCGNQYSCGTCTDVNKPNCANGTCQAAPCQPKSCLAQGKNCGQISDGCGKTLDCGVCSGSSTCGGAGTANVCGCTPKTCQQLGKNCDPQPDGCGGTTASCGTCKGYDVCQAGLCGCTPGGLCPPISNCGTVPDGCGGQKSCGGPCVLPQTCGGGGKANVCGCTPYVCQTGDCGTLSNGCGGNVNCGVCGGGCFVGGTPILMADGTSRPIEAVHAGDVVLSYDPQTGATVPQPVVQLLRRGPEASADGLVLIDGTTSTRIHPFLVDGHAVRADQIKAGDTVVHATVDGGRVTVKATKVVDARITPGSVPTYDLKLGGSGDFFVGDTHTLTLPKQ
jgi:hypothetical protein